MKKVLLILAVIFTFGYAAQAQAIRTGSSLAGRIKLGPKAGVNIATLSADDTKSLVGFHVGGFVEFMLTEKLALQPEVLYSAQGATADEGDAEWKLGYINIPFMVKYDVFKGLNLEAGPQMGFLISAEDEAGNDIKDSFESTDFGFNLGLGYSLPMGLMLSGRYTIGLSDVVKDNTTDSVKNGVIQASVGYKF
nr:porin family protein [uncultured Flavobacterium sp.]